MTQQMPSAGVTLRRCPATVLLIAGLVIGAGCSDPAPACVPGASAACACPSGGSGAQVCRSDGTFEACVCDTAPSDGGVGDLGIPEEDLSPQFPLDGQTLRLPGPVVFEFGKAVLAPESAPVLDFVKRYLEARPEVTLLRIENHTDNIGNPNDNQTLSEGRTMAVARWLITQAISCKRLLPVGFGGERPIASNATEEGRAQNRRTVFVNAALNGMLLRPDAADGGRIAGDPCR